MKRSFAVISVIVIALFALSSCANVKSPELQNGDFETLDGGLPQGWYSNVWDEAVGSISVSVDAERANVVHIVNSGATDSRVYQDIQVSPKTTYKITCYVKTKGVSGGAGAIIGIIGQSAASAGVYGDTDWTRVELIGKTAKAQKTLGVSIGLGGYSAESGGEAWFDCVAVEISSQSTDVLFGESNTSSQSTDDAPTEFPTTKIVLFTVISAVFLIALYFLYRAYCKKGIDNHSKKTTMTVILLLLAAFIVRIILALLFTGHKTDISCFAYWGNSIAVNGTSSFYNNWCDYPPGYMLVLGIMSKISALLQNSMYGTDGTYNAVYILLMKLPCIIIDIASAYVVFRLAKKIMSDASAVILMCMVAFSPIMAYISSVWGQIDAVLTFLMVIPILLIGNRRPICAGLVYGLAIVMKPQALMAGPLFAAAYIMYVLMGDTANRFNQKASLASILHIKKDSVWLRLAETFIAVMAAFGVIILIALPFTGQQKWYWLIEKYYNTATSYDYATVNAYNFWALIGANWKSIDTEFMGATYGKWGSAFMVTSVVLSIGLYVFDSLKHKGTYRALPLSMAFMFAGIFTFGHYMHERYLFPILMLLMIAFIIYNDKRLLWTYIAYSASLMLNCMAAYYYSEYFDYHLYWDEKLIFFGSLLNMRIFAWFAYVTFDLTIRSKPWHSYCCDESSISGAQRLKR